MLPRMLFMGFLPIANGHSVGHPALPCLSGEQPGERRLDQTGSGYRDVAEDATAVFPLRSAGLCSKRTPTR